MQIHTYIEAGVINFCSMSAIKFEARDWVPTEESTLYGLVVRVLSYWSRDPGLDSRLYQIFWGVVGLERGPLNLVSSAEELLGRNSSGSGLENREHGHGDPLCWPRDTLCPQKLALTSPRSRVRLVGIVRLRAKATEFVFLFKMISKCIANLTPELIIMKQKS
jgi:hypothetical protein